MSGFDLNQQEIDNRTARMPARTGLEPGAFDNFLAGTGKVTMQTLAKAGSAIDLLGSVGPIVQDKFTGGTEAQDRYFQEHEEVFGNAVDYWTPKPNEVGAAGQVVGQLLGTLPLVFASPGLAVGATQVSTAEDLAKKGVDPLKAQAAGAVQAAGLGLGIWVPILGKTLAQRVLLGGAGFNAVQGVATRGASGAILEGTPGAEDFKAFDPTSLTLDVLLGAAFGGIAHVSPAMRAEGAAWQSKLADWGSKLKPSEIDALITMRQAQHINADSMPGKPVDIADADAHVQRLRQAIDDLANDRPISVEQMPPARFEIDPARQAEAEAAAKVQEDVAAVLAPDIRGITVYHGTDRPFDVFDPANGGMFTSNMGRAQNYAMGSSGRVIEANLDIRNPMPWADAFGKTPAEIKASGFDGAIQWGANGEVMRAVVTDAAQVRQQSPKVGADTTAATPEQSSAVVKESLTPEIGDAVVHGSKLFSEDKRLSNLSPDGPSWERIRENNPALARTSGMDDEIIIYRATVGEEIRPDDFVTVDKKAARAELKNVRARDGAGKIIEKIVKVRDLLMANDATEFVFFPLENVPAKSVETDAPEPVAAPAARAVDQAGDIDAKPLDPLAAEAQRFAAENPDISIVIGKTADGEDITTTPRQMMEESGLAVEQARADATLFEVAASCLLGAK